MNIMKKKYESPKWQSVLLIVNGRFFSASTAEFSSSLENWQVDELTLD